MDTSPREKHGNKTSKGVGKIKVVNVKFLLKKKNKNVIVRQSAVNVPLSPSLNLVSGNWAESIT